MIFNSIRVYITEQCNAQCQSCFNKKNRSNALMDIRHFEELCRYFSNQGISRLKIMGGEPTIHPLFAEFMHIAQSYFPNIYLFTNAINNRILNFIPRNTDSIIYNYTFRKLWNRDKLLLENPGKRAFEIQIQEKTNEESIATDIKSLDEHRITPVLTLDCTSNIFKHRDLLISKIEYLQSFFNQNNIKHSMDHRIPLCFIYGSKIQMPISNFNQCTLSCSCLIDASYHLRFCNQSPNKLLSIYKDGKILPIQIIENALCKEFYTRQLENLNRICLNCIFYEKLCNGGCFMNNGLITKKDVINATRFPKI